MAALPYMQFYVADYLADTAHLTTEEHGAYLLLLFSYWQTGKPLKADRLASIARMSNERWTNVEQTLSEFFHVSKGTWIHFRVEADLEKVNTKSRNNSEAGKASARARAIAKQALAESESTNVATNAERLFNHARSRDTDTDTDTDTDQHQKPRSPQSAEHVDFDQFWKLYPRKVGKQAALKAWNKLKPDMILFAEIERALEISKRSPDWLKSAGQYIPHPSVWLNGRRWEDEQDPTAALPFEEIAEAYNEICGQVFLRCEAMTPQRMQLVRAVAAQEIGGKRRFIDGGLEYWRRFFAAAARSKSWAGQNARGLIADFDFVLRNATTVFEAKP